MCIVFSGLYANDILFLFKFASDKQRQKFMRKLAATQRKMPKRLTAFRESDVTASDDASVSGAKRRKPMMRKK